MTIDRDYPEQEFELREHVARFGRIMLGKLLEKRSKGGPREWRTGNFQKTFKLLQTEMIELYVAIGDLSMDPTNEDLREKVRKEAADVANFAMILADQCRPKEER